MRIILALLVCIFVYAEETLDWDSLDHDQRVTAMTIYELAKPYDLAETMIAIAWQESRLGKIPINLEDKASCGVHHVHIKTFLWQNKLKDTVQNRNVFCIELIKNVELSTENAIKFFQYAKKKHNGNHHKAIMSYNAGFNLKNNSKATKYLTDVRKWILGAKEVIKMIETINDMEIYFAMLGGDCE